MTSYLDTRQINVRLVHLVGLSAVMTRHDLELVGSYPAQILKKNRRTWMKKKAIKNARFKNVRDLILKSKKCKKSFFQLRKEKKLIFSIDFFLHNGKV